MSNAKKFCKILFIMHTASPWHQAHDLPTEPSSSPSTRTLETNSNSVNGSSRRFPRCRSFTACDFYWSRDSSTSCAFLSHPSSFRCVGSPSTWNRVWCSPAYLVLASGACQASKSNIFLWHSPPYPRACDYETLQGEGACFERKVLIRLPCWKKL